MNPIDIAADVDFRISEHCYSIRYEVPAATRLEAIDAAVGLLRSDVRLRGVNDASPGPAAGWWIVSLNVQELI